MSTGGVQAPGLWKTARLGYPQLPPEPEGHFSNKRQCFWQLSWTFANFKVRWRLRGMKTPLTDAREAAGGKVSALICRRRGATGFPESAWWFLLLFGLFEFEGDSINIDIMFHSIFIGDHFVELFILGAGDGIIMADDSRAGLHLLKLGNQFFIHLR